MASCQVTHEWPVGHALVYMKFLSILLKAILVLDMLLELATMRVIVSLCCTTRPSALAGTRRYTG